MICHCTAQHFLRKCLHKDPLKRATVDELLCDPFVNGMTLQDYDMNMLCIRDFAPFYNPYSPLIRLTICEVLACNMSAEIQEIVSKSFAHADATQRTLITKKDIVRLALRCGYNVEFGEAIAENSLSLFGQEAGLLYEQYYGGVDLFGIRHSDYGKLWQYRVLQEQEEYRYHAFEYADLDGDGFINGDDLRNITTMVPNYIIIKTVNETDKDLYKKWCVNRKKYQSQTDLRIHEILAEVVPADQEENIDVIGLSLQQFSDAMAQ